MYFMSPKVTSVPACHPRASREPHSSSSEEAKAEALGTNHSAQHLCIPFPPKMMLPPPFPTCRAGDRQRLTLVISLWLMGLIAGLYLFLKC